MFPYIVNICIFWEFIFHVFTANVTSITLELLINKRDVAGLYCRARANIHFAVIILTAAFTPPSVFVVFISLWRGKRVAYIYIFHPNTAQKLQVRSAGFEALSSLELHPGGLNYSLALQRHTGQTTVLQARVWGLKRSNNYSVTKIFVDIFYCRHCR